MQLLVVLSLLLPLCLGDLYFIIENAKVFQCAGGTSGLDIQDKDIRVTDTRGRDLRYISAPGEFVINFGKITVKRQLQNIAGELGVHLQVPIGSGGPFNIKWDIPYSAVPQKKLIGGFTCDENAGFVKTDRNVCRYCDLCKSTAKVERELGSGRKILPQLGGSERMFSTMCAEISPKTYSLTRTVQLPSKEELEQMVNQRYQGMDAGLRSKFKIGSGKFQVYLNLKSSPTPPPEPNAFYSGIKGCQCCVEGGRGGLFCRGCKEKCKTQYAEQCLGPGTQTVACYTVEFNFKATENYGDVQKFLRDHHFEDSGPSPSRGGTHSGGGGGGGGGQQACINAISSPTYKRYCQTRWNPAFCCNLCPGAC